MDYDFHALNIKLEQLEQLGTDNDARTLAQSFDRTGLKFGWDDLEDMNFRSLEMWADALHSLNRIPGYCINYGSVEKILDGIEKNTVAYVEHQREKITAQLQKNGFSDPVPYQAFVDATLAKAETLFKKHALSETEMEPFLRFRDACAIYRDIVVRVHPLNFSSDPQGSLTAFAQSFKSAARVSDEELERQALAAEPEEESPPRDRKPGGFKL